MNATVQLRNLVIGEGAPKICVPVLGTTQESIREAVEALKGHPFDMVEWRADYFEHVRQPEEVEAVLGMLRDILQEVPILFTVRTREEGGYQSVHTDDYIAINAHAAATGLIDMIDVESFAGDDIAFVVIEAAHSAGVKVIASNHHFDRTPKKEEMIMRLCKMQEMEADIVKMAVMPRAERDVLTLLDVTLTMKELHAVTPVVTMAMGELGLVSRLTGKIFGSAITFGSVGMASAPGQIPTERLRAALELI